MGTRAVVVVEGLEGVAMYKHWDGYPAAMLPWLEKFTQEFSADRGDDPEYCMAALLRSVPRMAGEFDLDDSPHTGYGILGPNTEWDYSYKYLIEPATGAVRIIE